MLRIVKSVAISYVARRCLKSTDYSIKDELDKKYQVNYCLECGCLFENNVCQLCTVYNENIVAATPQKRKNNFKQNKSVTRKSYTNNKRRKNTNNSYSYDDKLSDLDDLVTDFSL